MLINFNEMPERILPGMNGGTGEMTAKMYMSEKGKIIPCTIHKGGSIGLHTQRLIKFGIIPWVQKITIEFFTDRFPYTTI